MKKTVKVFDLDDTLIKTSAEVIYRDAAGDEVYRLGSQAYNERGRSYNLDNLFQSDVHPDFSEFDDPDILLSETKREPFNDLTLSAARDIPCVIITARSKKDIILAWLKANNVSLKSVTVICNTENAADITQFKAREVEKVIAWAKPDTVVSYEDNIKNQAAIRDVCREEGVAFESGNLY